ncbi:MAG: 30S ribosomal protein S15 [Candidatus Vogelbacteria bacterium]|nr:30S ribosomal protein S15 [Candidatus Vogelbacteria bacterium]
MISTKKKEVIIKKTRKHEKDTGSSEVQVALITERIAELADHLKKNPKDNHSRRGLLKLVADRRTHQKYLDTRKKKEELASAK